MADVLAGVVTTIHPPTPSVRRLAERLARAGAETIVVGDRKGPRAYDVPGTRLLSFEDQLAGPFALARLLPAGHYARKNVGYLHAMASGAACVYETDDDNHPAEGWAPRSRRVVASPVAAAGWLNAYAEFSDELIWPRGFPLDLVRRGPPATRGAPAAADAPIQQGLADVAPDVDAIWRLVLDRPFRFERRPSILLEPGTWCPFNSQSTWWWAPAFRLMYLPSHCSFRMTDIWRSFVAQRCLWELGSGVAFHAAEVEQDRNAHDLMRDFEDEVVGYRTNRRIAEQLAALRLAPGPSAVGDNLLRCYEALAANGHVAADELALVRAWNEDAARLGR